MHDLQGVEKIYSIRPRKRFGRPHSYGYAIYARSVYGDNDIFVSNSAFGKCIYGNTTYGDLIILSGVYHKNRAKGSNVFQRIPYMNPKNPRTIPQQAQRGKMTTAVTGWQALTTAQKVIYNVRAKRKVMSGYNLYIRESMSS